MTPIYLDNNATTPLLPAVWEAMRPFCTSIPGNPASSHYAGRKARQALEDAREKVAVLLGAHSDEVIFTSGATEANNLALFGLAGESPAHIVSSPIEHPSVGEPLLQLQARGFQISRLPVTEQGIVPADSLAPILQPEMRLVTAMLANNETGAVQPVRELGAALDGRAHFHCDAAQAIGRILVDFHRLGVTSLSLSAHKFHGPKGAGALLLRRHVNVRPLLFGGHQQHGHRPGTEATPLAVGLAVALELAVKEMEARTAHVLNLRRRFFSQLQDQAAPIVLNGPEMGGIPHTLNISFPGCRADVLLMKLDLAGIACSTGSACSSGSLLPSPVLQAMRAPTNVLSSAMRFSLSHLLSEAEIDDAARRIASVVADLRRRSQDE